MRKFLFILLVFPCLLAFAGTASAREVARISYPGMERLTFRYGPIKVSPGSNDINAVPISLRPRKPGFITRFQPDLVRVGDDSHLPTPTLHIHHAGWALNGMTSFAAGEERSILQFPRGFGVELSGNDQWSLTYMLHNQVSKPEQVYLVWKIDFVPQGSPGAKLLRGTYTRWTDVAGPSLYPVFDALRGWGSNGKYTFPDQARGNERKRIGQDQSWVLDQDATLVYAMGHLHPGGLSTNLSVTRNKVTKPILVSKAVYFSNKPRSYDFAMTAPPEGWKVKLKQGDTVSLSTTVDTKTASWREAMGIMPVVIYPGTDVGGVDPFLPGQKIRLTGEVTHGSLPESRGSGGSPTSLPDPRSLPDGPVVSAPVDIQGFRYKLGDLSMSRSAEGRPPVVDRGKSITFVNRDSAGSGAPAYHTITACRAPCTSTTGSAYPTENAPISFDSGQLGVSETQRPPAINRDYWSTPQNLPAGTYTFFCRVHPDMRGAFRVKGSPRAPVSASWAALPGGEPR